MEISSPPSARLPPMDVLRHPFDPGRDAERAWLPFPLGAAVPFLLIFTGGAVTAAAGIISPDIARPLATAGFHGGLLAAALASAWGRTEGWRGPAWLLAGLLFLASFSVRLSPWGAFAYMLVPLGLWALSRRHPLLRRIGWNWPEDNRAWLLGAGAGLFLGAHLLLSTSRTFGYPMRLTPVAPVLTAIAYDAGANVLSAELCFRGAMFNFWQRRSGFWAATVLSTAVYLLRYLGDPALPPTLEVIAGLVFYLALLSATSCALLALSGSVLPAALAALFFFSAYRTLQLW